MTDPEKPAAQAGGLIKTEVAAALLMVTVEWVRRLTNEGWITKVAKDQYRVQDVVQGYIKYLRDENRQTSKSAAASRVQDARAEAIQLQLDEKRGVMLQQGQAEAVTVIDEFFGGLRSDLMAIPARVTADLVLRRKIEDGIDDAFGAASKRAVDAADRVATAGEALRKAGSAKRRRVGAVKPRVPAKSRTSRSA
jgi:hypothetical protein